MPGPCRTVPAASDGLGRSLTALRTMRWLLFVAVVGAVVNATSLTPLNIDPKGVVAVGLGHSADFAHQFHVAFSSMVGGACLFSGQPFHCAVTRWSGENVIPVSAETRGQNCDNCPPNMTLPFDHCKKNPDVVDVGSLIDYPRRACGQNPITVLDCFDDVKFIKPARSLSPPSSAHSSSSSCLSCRVFAFRGTQDEVSCLPPFP